MRLIKAEQGLARQSKGSSRQLGKVDSVNFNRFGQNPVNSVNFNRFFVAQKRL